MTADELAIQNILRQMETGWNRYDSAGIAAWFAEDATLIHIYGGQLEGRTAIEASYRQIFDTIYRGSHARFTLHGIRFVRPDVAIVYAQAQVKFMDGNEAREIVSRPTLMVVKQQARWQIAAFQNTRISQIPAAAQAPARLAS